VASEGRRSKSRDLYRKHWKGEAERSRGETGRGIGLTGGKSLSSAAKEVVGKGLRLGKNNESFEKRKEKRARGGGEEKRGAAVF